MITLEMKKTSHGDCSEGEEDSGHENNQSENNDSSSIKSKANDNTGRSGDLKTKVTGIDNVMGKSQSESTRSIEQLVNERKGGIKSKEEKEVGSVKKAEDRGEVENVSPEQQPERRSSTRLRGKRPKLTDIITTSDEEENESDDDDDDDDVVFERKDRDRKRRKKSLTPKFEAKSRSRGAPKKNTESESKRKQDTVKESKSPKKSEDPLIKPPKEFTSGAYVVLKSDFHASMTPPIWKIDGKALLQKYTHFEEDGQTLYKNTSTYSGWTANNKDQYYPASVEIKLQTRKETVVKFNRDAIHVEDSD